jgi:hypothetical protein
MVPSLCRFRGRYEHENNVKSVLEESGCKLSLFKYMYVGFSGSLILPESMQSQCFLWIPDVS